MSRTIKIHPSISLDELESLEFTPESIDLPSDFLLTNYASLKGCGCKVPRPKLLDLLDGIGDGIGMDSSIKSLKTLNKQSENNDVDQLSDQPSNELSKQSNNQSISRPQSHSKLTKAIIRASKEPGYSLVSSTDFFYPLVEDPYMQGAIAAANVLSDIYATGVSEVDSVLMILGQSLLLDETTGYKVTRRMIEGFSDHCNQAGVSLSGGQSVYNPWPIIGGTAMACVINDTIVWPHRARAGDVLVLTKPLGVQIATNIKQWSRYADYQQSNNQSNNQAVTLEAKQRFHDRWLSTQSLDPPLSRHELLYIFHRAQQSCMRLNRVAAQLAHKYEARASTDVTGFGLMGHATNLLALQSDNVDFMIDRLPCIKGTMRISDALNMRLRQGLAAETSGGLLIAMSSENAKLYCEEIEMIENETAWIIGRVVQGNRTVHFTDDMEIIEV